MNLEQIAAERRMLEAQLDLAVEQFMKRCGLEKWQVTVSWGPVEVSINDGPGQKKHMAMARVSV